MQHKDFKRTDTNFTDTVERTGFPLPNLSQIFDNEISYKYEC